MKILVTGGCGFKGNVLIPKLLEEGHVVTAFDIQWFGNDLKQHTNLEVLKGDVRNIEEVPLEGVDCIIHLASIANDPCGVTDLKAVPSKYSILVVSSLKRNVPLSATDGLSAVVPDAVETPVDLDFKKYPIFKYSRTKH